MTSGLVEEPLGPHKLGSKYRQADDDNEQPWTWQNKERKTDDDNRYTNDSYDDSLCMPDGDLKHRLIIPQTPAVSL